MKPGGKAGDFVGAGRSGEDNGMSYHQDLSIHRPADDASAAFAGQPVALPRAQARAPLASPAAGLVQTSSRRAPTPPRPRPSACSPFEVGEAAQALIHAMAVLLALSLGLVAGFATIFSVFVLLFHSA